MNNEQNSKATLWLIVCVGILLLASILETARYRLHTKMATLGYEQVVLPGLTVPAWQKVKP